jgi:AcrR family transcriptional regulator
MSTTTRPRGSYAKTAERRLEILAAGTEVFAASGFRSGSIREVAERVGISQAGLLHHFSSKAELLAAILSHRDDEDQRRINLSVPGLENIRGLVKLTERNATVPGLVQLYCTLSAEATDTDHPAHQYFVDRYNRVRGIIQESFQIMLKTGQLAEGTDPAGTARSLIALMDGLQVQWLLDRKSVDMAEEIRRYLRPLVRVEL